MPKKLLRRILPDRQTIERIPVSRRFSQRFDHPGLWLIEREAIARGLAVGVLCGMIPGPLQMIAAISCAFLFRLNLPMAVVGTFLTNPFTIVPIYMAAYGIGQWLSGGHASGAEWHQIPALPQTDWQSPLSGAQAWWQWIMDLGMPWVTGMLVLSVSLALLSYMVMQIVWRGSRYWHLTQLQTRRRHRTANS